MNTGVVGASLYKDNQEPIQPESVVITFKNKFSQVNITGTLQHYVGKVTKNRVPPCSAVILPLTWYHRHLDCKSKKLSSDMVRSGLKISRLYGTY